MDIETTLGIIVVSVGLVAFIVNSIYVKMKTKRTATATLKAKLKEKEQVWSLRLDTDDYYLNFETTNGKIERFKVKKDLYDSLNEGQLGLLSFKYKTFKDFSDITN